MTVRAEPPVQVGSVSVVYLSVTNVSTHTIEVEELHAIGHSEVGNAAINIDLAIERGGSAGNIAAALDRLPSTAEELASPLTTFIPGTKPNRHSLGWGALVAPLDFPDAAILLLFRSVAAVVSVDRLRLMDGSFYPAFSAEEIAKVGSGESRRGYVFFADVDYSGIEVSARDPKTLYRQTVKCPWHSGEDDRCGDVQSPMRDAIGR